MYICTYTHTSTYMFQEANRLQTLSGSAALAAPQCQACSESVQWKKDLVCCELGQSPRPLYSQLVYPPRILALLCCTALGLVARCFAVLFSTERKEITCHVLPFQAASEIFRADSMPVTASCHALFNDQRSFAPLGSVLLCALSVSVGDFDFTLALATFFQCCMTLYGISLECRCSIVQCTKLHAVKEGQVHRDSARFGRLRLSRSVCY